MYLDFSTIREICKASNARTATRPSAEGCMFNSICTVQGRRMGVSRVGCFPYITGHLDDGGHQ